VLAEKIGSQGGTVAAPNVGHALIDTGATKSCVDEQALATLAIRPVGQTKVLTPSGSETQFIHPVRLTFVGTTLGSIEPIAVLASKLKDQGLLALIGRDILAHCILVYNGPGGIFTLAV